MWIASVLLLLSLGLLVPALAQLWAPNDLAAILLGAAAPRPAWVLAAFGLVATILALLAVRRAHRAGRPRTAAIGAILGCLGGVAAFSGLWMGRASYQRSAVFFPADDGTRLAATLYMPDDAAEHPAIVLAPGSAAAPRRAYGYVADRLCRAGFAVLVADKRGVGESAGGYDRDNNSSRATLELLGNDLAASWKWLVRQPGIDRRHVGYWGVSQAGWTVPVALERTPGAAFAVLLSGPVTTVGEENAFSRLAGESADPMGSREPPLPLEEVDRRLDALPAAGFDPQPYLERSTVPMLYVFGAWDNSIPAARSARRLAALAQRGKPFSAVVLPEANHLLLVARGPHRGLLPAFAPEAWPTMLRWLRQRTAADPSGL